MPDPYWSHVVEVAFEYGAWLSRLPVEDAVAVSVVLVRFKIGGQGGPLMAHNIVSSIFPMAIYSVSCKSHLESGKCMTWGKMKSIFIRCLSPTGCLTKCIEKTHNITTTTPTTRTVSTHHGGTAPITNTPNHTPHPTLTYQPLPRPYTSTPPPHQHTAGTHQPPPHIHLPPRPQPSSTTAHYLPLHTPPSHSASTRASHHLSQPPWSAVQIPYHPSRPSSRLQNQNQCYEY